MLQFNELRVTADNKCLIIDVQVDDLCYFENVTIESIIVNTQDTYTPTGPNMGEHNEYVVYSPEMKDLDIINDGVGRHVRIELKHPFICSGKNTMYFVYAIADVSNAPEATMAPCTCNHERIMGTVVNNYNLYNTLMNGIKELANDCDVPRHFIDDYLRIQAIDASIKTGNYPMAIKYWEKFFSKKPGEHHYKPCGCHGKH